MTVSQCSAILTGTSRSLDPAVAAAELHGAIHQPETAVAFFYCSNEYDVEALGRELKACFGDILLIGCTTAGEITGEGYAKNSVTGFSLPTSEFQAVSLCLDDLAELGIAEISEAAGQLLTELRAKAPTADPRNTFAYLLIDGLSMKEEAVVSTLHKALDLPLIGASAGDGLRFEKTLVFHGGESRSDRAVVTLIHSRLPMWVFKADHFSATEGRIVVTEADPERRVVTEINGEPAGREYARVLGLDPEALTPMIFAAHPVVVRVGGQYYVRSIQKVNPDGSLTFYCAIDEGIVLTVATGLDINQKLREAMEEAERRVGHPQLVLASDCILRRLELEQKGLIDEASAILAQYNVVGFSTYGEQFAAMHVNQTITGVAIGGSR